MTKAQLPLSTFDLAPGEFDSRSDWARSRGRWAWLWPSIPIERWRSARELVTAILGEVLVRGESDRVLDGDPEVLSLAAYTAGVGPLFGWWIREGRIAASESASAVSDLHLRHNEIRMKRMSTRATEAVERLVREGVKATLLKGMHTAFVYFPNSATRPSSDIDLLVCSDDAERANGCFEQSGYRLTYQSPRERSWSPPNLPQEPRSLLLTHADDPWTIDLHNSLDYLPAPTIPSARLDLVAASCDTAAWPVAPSGHVLAQPLLLLHLAVHTGSSMTALNPLRIAEIVLVICRDAPTGALRWDAFLMAARDAGALGIVFPALYFAERLCPGTIPPEVLEASASTAPIAVRRHMQRFSPATAQRIDRLSIAEHFMWSQGWRALGRQVVHDLVPIASPSALAMLYRKRVTQLIGRKFTR